MDIQISKTFAGVSLLFSALIFSAPSYATVSLDVQNGTLMGASGINVNGTLYDVQFEDGSCNSLFNNCDSSTFAFHTSTDSYTAQNALLQSVFGMGASTGTYGTDFTAINGCLSLTICNAWMPYATFLGTSGTEEFSGGDLTLSTDTLLDSTGDANVYAASDFSTDAVQTFAVWSLHSVPEPASLALLAIGLVGLGLGVNRKSKNTSLLA